MITITVEHDSDDHIVAFAVRGHSGYAESGQDIVCAGVSALVQTTILGLQEIVGIDCAGRQEKGDLICRLPAIGQSARYQADILLKTMLLGLTAIAEVYANYVQIRDLKEV